MLMLTADPTITTIEQLRELPEDGLRHELIRGEHVVTPSPRVSHQAVQRELTVAVAQFLREASHFVLFPPPSDVVLGTDTLV